MFVTSVERDARPYYLTCGDNPNGLGILAIISRGSPQFGDAEVALCDLEVCKNMKAAKKWYRRQMKTKPWEQFRKSPEVPSGLGKITGLRAEGGRLLVETESGVPMVVPLAGAIARTSA